ncbi:hypothetical protein C8A05DRAFT_33460 [Staphylotrichum tortipilum]|uniref:Uncharacterized protein n=1 Tax=Staphylotrichum tortipilum TaxID=2831512 RepID=A0AAN6MLU0_9PEZI|nr:hypothetical protein C8A05DRAFT_33460 [Staphylotrichum longicolle]
MTNPNNALSNARSTPLSSSSVANPNPLHKFLFHLQTLWLFTHSDLKTIILPSTLFGLTNAAAAPQYGLNPPLPSPPTTTTTQPPLPSPLTRTPLVLLWVYLNLLPFTISNQLPAPSIREDALNKPWRPLPAGRLTPRTAQLLILTLYPLALLSSTLLLGAPRQAAALLVLGGWYNSLGGGETNPLVRNGINAAGELDWAVVHILK